jgi:hypothetical protein
MPSKMTETERDEFMKRPHLGYLGIGRVDKGPLLAPIWYAYDPAIGVQINMGATSAPARRRTREHARRRSRPWHLSLGVG